MTTSRPELQRSSSPAALFVSAKLTVVGSRKLNEEVKLEKNGSTPKLERRCLAVLENVTLIFHQQP
ncbi:hypothetical protein, partial [Sinorhizobium meliloti]|uniref:hypothetical protein n=1 Tax=Rhizobium meliloti TaxID=382 RepID=UPI001AEC7B93